MTRGKIFYGLCIAALGLPFVEAMKTTPNIGGSNNKTVRSPQNNIKNCNQVIKKTVSGGNDQSSSNVSARYNLNNMCENINNCKTSNMCNENDSITPGCRQQVCVNPGSNQYPAHSYGKYEVNYSYLPKLNAVFINNDRYSGDEVEIIAYVLTLVLFDCNRAASVLNILAKSTLESLKFLCGKKYDGCIVPNIVMAAAKVNSYGLSSYITNANNKLRRMKGIADGKTLADYIISVKEIQELAVSPNTKLKKLDKRKDCKRFDNIGEYEVPYKKTPNKIREDTIKVVVYLRNVKMLSYENIAIFCFFAGLATYEFCVNNLNDIYARVGADRIWRRDIIESMKKNKKLLETYEGCVLNKYNCVDNKTKPLIANLMRALELNSYSAVSNGLYCANNFTAEQIKIIKFFCCTDLKDAEVVEIFNRMFNGSKCNSDICGIIRTCLVEPNESRFLYEIDDWLYLTDSDKKIIKDSLLEYETTRKKAAQLLLYVCSFKEEDAIRIANDVFSNCMWRQGSNSKSITANLQLDKIPALDNINQEDLVIDLAFLDLLNKISLSLSDERKEDFKNGLKTFINGTMRDTERNNFVNKLKEYDIGILMDGVDKIELDVYSKSKYKKYDANRISSSNEQDEILNFLASLNLSKEKREEIKDVIFFNDFYKIDELSYLSSEQKENIKNKLLGLTITWKKVVNFLRNKKLFSMGDFFVFSGNDTAKIIEGIFQAEKISNLKNVIARISADKILETIDLKDLILDLASLGLLKEIGVHIEKDIEQDRKKKLLTLSLKSLSIER